MSFLDGFGIAESLILFILGLGKFVHIQLKKELEDRRQAEAKLFDLLAQTREDVAHMRGQRDG